MLYGAPSNHSDGLQDWVRLADLSFPLGAQATVTVAELEECTWGVSYLLARFQGGHAAQNNVKTLQVLDTRRFELLELSNLVS